MARVMLIPGNMCDARLWGPVGAQLAAAGHKVIHAPRLDQPSIDEMVDATRAELGGKAVVVGFSMGAIVAAHLADRAPEQVIGVGLVAFNASGDLPERAAVRPRQQAAVRAGGLDDTVANELKPNYLAAANRGDPDLLQIVMDMARSLGSDAFIAQSEALRLRPDFRLALPKLTMPVLLACGSEDALCPPAWHRRWADAIGGNARLVVVPDAGHLLPLEQPQSLAAEIAGWLAQEVQCPAAS
jgi:pimeloyl-ACP methyl ester carboxylesterase